MAWSLRGGGSRWQQPRKAVAAAWQCVSENARIEIFGQLFRFRNNFVVDHARGN